MASSTKVVMKSVLLALILVSFTIYPVTSASTAPECQAESTDPCVNKSKALPLKIIAIFCVLVASMFGVGAPLLARSVPYFQPDGNVFVIIKCFASGIILGTSFMHVLVDSFHMLESICLDERPWNEFPFTGFFAMVSGLVTLAIDSVATSLYSNKKISVNHGHGHGHGHGGHEHEHENEVVALPTKDVDSEEKQLMRYRVIAMVLEFGIIVHSVVIGLALGATNNVCTIKSLLIALCFHQGFEGIGLGGCILQAQYTNMKNFVMAFFFTVTTPFGIALGIGLSTIYRDNSPTALITVGILNACSAGLLIYMALVDLLAAEFMGPKLQASLKLQFKCFVSALFGCTGMALLARWA